MTADQPLTKGLIVGRGHAGKIPPPPAAVRPERQGRRIEQVGWVRYDGDEFHSFIYFRPEEQVGRPGGHRDRLLGEGWIPVWADLQP